MSEILVTDGSAAFSLEQLLGRANEDTFVTKPNSTSSNEEQGSKPQKAESNCTLFEFIKMVNKVSSIVLKDLDVEFIPDENKNIVTHPDLRLDHPVITYKVISRKPDELKPRVREDIGEKAINPDDERVGQIYGQKFTCHIQFNIFASVYETAEQVMERFEEMLFTYTGYFKKNGVGEMYFEQQLTDESYDMFRQTISVRNIRYYVGVEKLIVLFQEKIKEIETFGL